jgi:hypothetical protein
MRTSAGVGDLLLAKQHPDDTEQAEKPENLGYSADAADGRD